MIELVAKLRTQLAVMGSLNLHLVAPFAAFGPFDVFWLVPFAFFKLVQLFLLFVGLKGLILGGLSIGGGRETTGAGARIAAFILIIALPGSLLVQFGSIQETDETWVWSFYWTSGIWVDLGFVVGCGLVGFMIAGIAAASHGIGEGEYRYGTASRGDIYLPKSDGQPTPSAERRPRRRPPRPRKQTEIEEPEVVEEVDEVEDVEEAKAPRPRKRPVRGEDGDEYEDEYEEDEDDFRPRKRSRRVLLIVLGICVPLVLVVGGLVLFLVLSGSSSLREYEFGEAGRKFRVRMPEGASEEANQALGRRSRTVEVKQKNGLHYFLKESQVEAPPGLDAKQRWLDGLRYSEEGLNVTSEKRTLWDSDNPGRLLEGNVTDSEKRFRARVWLVDDRFYFLIVRGPAGKIKSADVTRFLDSLELPYHSRSR